MGAKVYFIPLTKSEIILQYHSDTEGKTIVHQSLNTLGDEKNEQYKLIFYHPDVGIMIYFNMKFFKTHNFITDSW